MSAGRFLSVCLGGYLLAICLACDGGEAVKTELPPILGTLELPISHRSSGAEPQDATRVEIGTSEVRIDGEKALQLENGKVRPADVQSGILTALKGKLGSKRVLAISVHAATPYVTLAQLLNTGFSGGAKEIAFKVRKGMSTNTGWLAVRQNHFVESAEDGKFAEGDLPAWDSFTKVWEDAVDACQITQRGDCGYKPLAKAMGGKLDLMLRARGTGLALRFRQTGVPAPTPAEAAAAARARKPRRAELLDGVRAAPAAEDAPPEPSKEHVFTLRADQATVEPSPVSGIMKTVCGSITCPAVVDADDLSMSGRVIALVGAAYPDGSGDPKLAWVLPSK